MGLQSSIVPQLNPLTDFVFINNDDEVCCTYNLNNMSLISRIVINEKTSTLAQLVGLKANKYGRVILHILEITVTTPASVELMETAQYLTVQSANAWMASGPSLKNNGIQRIGLKDVSEIIR